MATYKICTSYYLNSAGFTPKPEYTYVPSDTGTTYNLDCDSITDSYYVIISGVTNVGERMPSENQLWDDSAAATGVIIFVALCDPSDSGKYIQRPRYSFDSGVTVWNAPANPTVEYFYVYNETQGISNPPDQAKMEIRIAQGAPANSPNLTFNPASGHKFGYFTSSVNNLTPTEIANNMTITPTPTLTTLQPTVEWMAQFDFQIIYGIKTYLYLVYDFRVPVGPTTTTTTTAAPACIPAKIYDMVLIYTTNPYQLWVRVFYTLNTCQNNVFVAQHGVYWSFYPTVPTDIQPPYYDPDSDGRSNRNITGYYTYGTVQPGNFARSFKVYPGEKFNIKCFYHSEQHFLWSMIEANFYSTYETFTVDDHTPIPS